MNAPLPHALAAARPMLADEVAAACDRIAPTWPLDQFIAVNPWWGWRGEAAPQAAARLGALGGARLSASREWLQGQWQAGQLRREHLEAALAETDPQRVAGLDADGLVAALHQPAGAVPRLPLITDLAPSLPGQAQPWPELVVHQLSQHCAAWFDEDEARWSTLREQGLFASWRTRLAGDRGIAWRRGRAAAVALLEACPGAPLDAIEDSLNRLAIPLSARGDYLTALLLSVQGWASWCAWLRWQARLQGQGDERIVELLAMRLRWEVLIAADAGLGGPPWVKRWAEGAAVAARWARQQRADWLLQRAAEIAYQQPLAAALAARGDVAGSAAAPQVQAVFCIDVRSEVFRRALEAVHPAVETRGFAGFFGLPLAYQPLATALQRSQLPGLLAPSMTVTERADERDGDRDPASDGGALGQWLAKRRRQALDARERWAGLRGTAGSAFSFVEACGLGYAAKLLADSRARERAPARWEDTGLPATAHPLRPRLDNDPAALDSQADAAAAVLRAMGLTRRFAPLVLLVGHGSQTRNNPHAAGLDCGACGGQTGEVNARVLAELLNRPALRERLAERGIEVPAGTHFVPALHNTTTDDVVLHDTDLLPTALHDAVESLAAALRRASDAARAERAAALGESAASVARDGARDASESADAGSRRALARRLRQRADDWAQLRPEWGLAGNAAFVVAPRERTRGMNLGGRVFLHDYDWRSDEGFATLELIMTAPMVVTNWINLQYLASVVDPQRHGSGNKLLHNVVGGRIGVFEGNGGDLRIGLPLQSVHDGQRWRHDPLRLAVFIEAPREAIDGVIARHAVVRELVENGWLHLLRLDAQAQAAERRSEAGWSAFAGAVQ